MAGAPSRLSQWAKTSLTPWLSSLPIPSHSLPWNGLVPRGGGTEKPGWQIKRQVTCPPFLTCFAFEVRQSWWEAEGRVQCYGILTLT